MAETDVADACFAPCPRGLEAALVEELTELGLAGAVAVAGGVHFTATWRDVYRVNLHSRLASRVLRRVVRSRYRSEDDIYRLAKTYDWSQWFAADHTLRVDVATGSGRQRSALRSMEFVTLRVKDGICDRFREASGVRPSIDTRAPDVRVFAYLDAHDCTLYLDTSGEPLFKRGWREDAGEAPLRENLAAGILRIAGWTPGVALLDPMCGSGTFAVEAAQRALGIAPGRARAFGFERLATFDADTWDALKVEADGTARGASTDSASSIRASDVSGDAVVATRANLERAGVPPELAQTIAPKQVDARQVKPHAPTGILVTNPPYGERIGIRGETSADADEDPLSAFLAEFGDTLKQRFAGWDCQLLSSDLAIQRKIHLAPDRRVPLFNGALECRLYRFTMVAGRR